MNLKTYTAVLSVLLASLLSACAPAMIGGAVVSGLVAVDRRTAGTQVEDEGIELRAIKQVSDTLRDRGHVNITSYNRQVLITGEVPQAQDRQLVERIVTQVENVRSVVNELAVQGTSSLGERTTDTLITGRVKAALVDAEDLYASAFKVVTERGTTYLMGRVTRREADRATEIARGTSGVKKVIRVFELITEDELRRLLPPPPKK